MNTKPEPGEWRPVSEYREEFGWVPTCKLGERGFNLCRRVHGDEWVEHGSGVTTVTHHSFAAPTHFIILPEAPNDQPHDF